MKLSKVEISCKQREMDELELKRKKLKSELPQHRDETTLTNGISELEKINSEILALRTEIEDNKDLVEQPNEKREQREILANMNIEKTTNIRLAFAKQVLFQSTGRNDCKLTDVEQRALGAATTTSSDVFSAPTVSADGVNNGGIFIPDTVLLDILKDEVEDSPIYNDIAATVIKGKTKFPYRLTKSGAKNKEENKPDDNESVKWDILSGITGNYTDSIVLTFEEEAMAIEAFADYLISILGESMRELLIADYIYGTGTGDKVKGITIGAIDASYTAANKAKYSENIENGIKKLPTKKRAGAKIYLASDIFDGMTFTKDANGNYILPVLNGGGLTKISSFIVAMDPNLNSGDFIIGNITKHYKVNINKSMELGLDISNAHRTKTYTSHMLVTATPVPNSIVYGKQLA